MKINRLRFFQFLLNFKIFEIPLVLKFFYCVVRFLSKTLFEPFGRLRIDFRIDHFNDEYNLVVNITRVKSKLNEILIF